ncbi:MAG: quinolinate synthase NadA [Clostridia bacterium]|nr:quinolinate synthase NadA [Clostridia bacterium]
MQFNEIQKQIIKLKKETDTVILAHTYQNPEITEIADFVGDSFVLAKYAKEVKAKRIIMCGVRFMGETVKILSPDKEVIMPTAEALCPMAEMIDPKDIVAFKEKNPDYSVVCYINTTAETKAVCDVCVTSSSAIRIVKSMNKDKILFVPDKNLGSFVQKAFPEKDIVVMDGYCPVHNDLTAEQVKEAKEKYPAALFTVHPEAPAEVVELADHVGSTSAIIEFIKNNPDKQIIIGTESGVYNNLIKTDKNPDRLIQLSPDIMVCEDMKKITLESVLSIFTENTGFEINLPEKLRKQALVSIENMLTYGD